MMVKTNRTHSSHCTAETYFSLEARGLDLADVSGGPAKNLWRSVFAGGGAGADKGMCTNVRKAAAIIDAEAMI